MVRWLRLLLRWIRRLWLIWLIVAGVLIVGAILWAAVVEPAWLLPDTRGLSAADRVKAQTDFRNTLVTMLGGLAVLAGAVVGGLTLRETGRQNRAVLELQRRGQVTERFTTAIGQLGQRGDETLDVRIGAVYALEQIARDSAELHWPVMEVLTAYLREHAPAKRDADDVFRQRLLADHQAIATVLGRRKVRQDAVGQRLDLLQTDLHQANLGSANLRGANLHGANLHGANLGGANLRAANLHAADLGEAILGRANLNGANLAGANLKGANLNEASLTDTNLNGANLGQASLRKADLSDANLQVADLRGSSLVAANLSGADLGGAHLGEANLRDAIGLTAMQLENASSTESAEFSQDAAEQLDRRARATVAPPVPDA